ncbi:MAG: DNA replication and repair protein RecF [Treponema sp.]|nr:DNA replication and repair protein RecF [Treponema sp.]
MIIRSVQTVFFRNLTDGITDTGAKDIFLIGENGQGKSNFIEAVYYSAYASSFRGAADRELAHFNEKSDIKKSTEHETKSHDFSVSLSYNDPLIDQVLVKYEGGKKSIRINGKTAADRKELLGIAPCIVFCHEDMEFVTGSPERRRWFFDQTLSLMDPVYLDMFRRYRRVLKEKNALLRNCRLRGLYTQAAPVLDVLDSQLVSYGLSLMEKREETAEQFSRLFTRLYGEVSGIEGLEVRYQSSWKRKEDAEKTLLEKRQMEFAAGLSLSGPHRDRYNFYREGNEFTRTASTGQRRLLALLLRSAQAKIYREAVGKDPILLLDDVLLEMDGEKRRRFLAVLPSYSQAFYTFLLEEPYQAYKKDDTLIYRLVQGSLEPV